MARIKKSAEKVGRDGEQFHDSVILSRLQVGGIEQLATEFATVREDIKAMIWSRLDQRLHSRVDASDIAQEAFVRAASGLQRFLENPNIHPIIWLRLIAKHIVSETHRRHFRSKRTPYAEMPQADRSHDRLVEHMADSMCSVHTQLVHEEVLTQVRTAFTQLGDNDREVLEMRHTDGKSLVEIANLLQITHEAAKKRYQRALERFRDLTKDLTHSLE